MCVCVYAEDIAMASSIKKMICSPVYMLGESIESMCP